MGKITRRTLLQTVGSAGLFAMAGALRAAERDQELPAISPRVPSWVYDPWSAYTDDTEADWREIVGDSPNAPPNTRLTEQLALRELDALAKMKAKGARIDYYHMNGFWFDPDGGYRHFRRKDWPKGPERWLAGCQALGIKPGLWIGTNTLWKINPAPAWQSSMASSDAQTNAFATLGPSVSLFEGDYLADLITVLSHWYDRGVRMFDLDVLNLNAATARARAQLSKDEIRERNRQALMEGLRTFRRDRPDVILTSYTGYIGGGGSMVGHVPPDHRWLEVFDAMMCGEIVVSDIPQTNFWRSLDIGPDQAVRFYEARDVSLSRIDALGTSFSTSWYGYNRQKAAWKGMLLLTAARGSLKRKIWGSVSLLNEDDIEWLAKVQDLYAALQPHGQTSSFGGLPEQGEPFGYATHNGGDAIYTVINPGQSIASVELPRFAKSQAHPAGRVLFRDAGFVPKLAGRTISLGPGQMAAVGFGVYAASQFDLGIQMDVVIPTKIAPLPAAFADVGKNVIEATLAQPLAGDLRMIFRYHTGEGKLLRSGLGTIEVRQGDRRISVARHTDGVFVHKGSRGYAPSWAAGEVNRSELATGVPVTVRFSLDDQQDVKLTGELYSVGYA